MNACIQAGATFRRQICRRLREIDIECEERRKKIELIISGLLSP